MVVTSLFIIIFLAPKIKFEKTEHDFGEIRQNMEVTCTFRFWNKGDDTLIIKNVRAPCGCTPSVASAKIIPPQGEGKIKTAFRSRGYKGKVTKKIYVSSNDPTNPVVYLQIHATILPQIKSYFFYSKDCKKCDTVVKDIFPPLREKYNMHIKFLDLERSENYELLLKLEEKYGDTDNEIPVMIIGEYILGGKEEIKKKLEKILKQYKTTGCEFPTTEVKDSSRSSREKKIYLAYFYESKCKECDRVSFELSYLKNRYPNLVIKEFDLGILENKKLNEAFCKLYNVPQKERLVAPIIFIGKEFLVKKEINNKKLVPLVEKYRSKGTKIIWEEAEQLKEESEIDIKERFSKMSGLAIFFAGLVAGVNPCAIAAVILFISFLSVVGKKSKELLLTGITFTSVVFITYFLIGFGLLRFLRDFEFTSIVGKIIFSGVAILALIFGCLNVYDYFKFKKGKHEEAKLKLPKFLKKRIDTLIREKMEMKNTIIAAIIIGFGVSVGGFICTGQVYLPTIMFVVTQYSALKIKGLAYLFLYNLAFVMPLIIIFTAAYKGTESINLSLFWRKHAKLSKLAASFVFFLLAGLLIFYTYF